MNSVLKSELNYKKTMMLISVLSMLFGIGLSFFGELCLPFASAALAMLYLYDSRSKKQLSFLVSAGVFAVNIIVSIFSGTYSAILAIEAIILAFVMCICYRKGTGKAGTALYTTAISSVFFILFLIAIPMIAQRTVSFDAVKTFYTDIYNVLKQTFIDAFNELYASLGDEAAMLDITTADIEAVFARAAYMLISFVVIIGFTVAGFSLKCFKAAVKRLDDDTMRISSWDFCMPSLYGYFFMFLVLVNAFMSASLGVFELAMANLYNIFLCVYAYVGLKLVYRHFSAKRSKLFVLILIAVILLLASSLAVQILAMVGVFHSFYRNKINSVNDN